MEKQEIWKPVVGYEGLYEVSNWGRVRSLPRNGTKGGILKPSPDGGGYLQVKLYKNGEKNMRKVHILVMLAFVGKCPKNHEIDHYDWNPRNNKLDNLSYQPKEVNRARKSPEGLQNVSEAAKRRAQDPEWRKNNADALKKLHQDQEWRKKVREGVKKRSQNQEWRKNVAEAAKKLHQDPEYLKKTAEATRKACCKPVNQFTLEGEYIKSWQSAREAARKLGCQQSAISECCRGKRKTTGGFIWKFAEPC